jgi:hypothetical protein
MVLRSLAAGSAVGLTSLAFSCNAIVGEKDLTFTPDGGAGGGDDGPGGLDGSSSGADTGGGGGDSASESGGPCSDTTSDGKNCGRCGHDCLGGKCVASKCQPVALRSGISPRVVAVDNDHVYYTESNAARVGQMNKDGTAQLDLALGGAKNSYPIGFASDGTDAFWGGLDGFLLKCKLGGCANTPTDVTATGSFIDLTVDATKLYWIEGSPALKVMSLAKSTVNGAAGTPLGTGSAQGFNRIAQDTTDIYVSSDDGNVRRISKTDGTTAVVAKGTSTTFGIAVDSANVYFSDGDDPATISVALKTANNVAGTPFAAGQHHPLSIAVDANGVYWANSYVGLATPDGTIMMQSLAAGSTAITLADKQSVPVWIAVDATAIYWANFDAGNGNGAIMKVARP